MKKDLEYNHSCEEHKCNVLSLLSNGILSLKMESPGFKSRDTLHLLSRVILPRSALSALWIVDSGQV